MPWKACEHLYVYSSPFIGKDICINSYKCKLNLEKPKDEKCNGCVALPEERK